MAVGRRGRRNGSRRSGHGRGVILLDAPDWTVGRAGGSHDWLVSGKLADDLRFVADNHVALNQVFQLADIARPVVFHHPADGIVAEGRRLLAVKLAVLAQKEIQKYRDLLA